MALNAGAIIAGYRVESEVGRGSMGTVYLARDLALERAVALKILVPELARDERFRERFLSESRLAASLEHPHIVPIYSAGEDDGNLFIAMRYVEGRDLDALLADVGKLEPGRSVALLRQLPRRSTRHTNEVWSTATSSRRTSWSHSTRVATSPTCATSGSRSMPPRFRV